MVTKEMVKHIASLARIQISDEEIENYQGHMEKVLAYMEQLKEVNIEGIPAMTNPMRENVDLFPKSQNFRHDEIAPSLEVQQILRNAPESYLNQFKVEAVIEEN